MLIIYIGMLNIVTLYTCRLLYFARKYANHAYYFFVIHMD